MRVNSNTRTIIGQVFFALSILMLIYLLISPLTQVIGHIDEYFTLTVINFPVGDILHILGGDVNPPLYYLGLKALSKLTTDFAILKIFSIIPYVIILLVALLKLKDEYGWLTIGLFTFAISVTSQFATKYLLLRPYSWAMLFVFLAFLSFNEIIKKQDSKSYIMFTAFTTLASYTHYYGLIASICLYLILLFHTFTSNKDKIKYCAISLAAAIILYAPWIPTLINLLGSIHESFWVPAPTADTVIQSFGFFAYSGDTLFSIITILILVIVAALYFKSEKGDRTVIYAIVTYAATIVLVLVISLVFKPILVERALLPIAAVLWLAIAIMASKIQSGRQFTIALALIILLFAAGLATTVITTDEMVMSGIAQGEVLDNITDDNESMVIVTSPNMVMYFLGYADDVDMYCINQDYIYGENMNRTHEIFNFKDISPDEIRNLSSNNTNRSIYIISWGDPEVDVDTTPILKQSNIVISKVDTSKLQQTEEEIYY